MLWTEVTTSTVLAHMPTDVLTRYNAWLVSYPDRAARLATITANTIREFRDALKSNQANIVHATETYLPQSCIRHCENIIIFTLCMEMGLNMDTAGQSARVAADVFLRQIPYGRWNTTTEDDADQPGPSYKVPTTTGRALPAIVSVVLLCAARAFGGWIATDATITDTAIYPSYVPAGYSITAGTLYGHLHGIDTAISALPTWAGVTTAITARISTEGAVLRSGDAMTGQLLVSTTNEWDLEADIIHATYIMANYGVWKKNLYLVAKNAGIDYDAGSIYLQAGAAKGVPGGIGYRPPGKIRPVSELSMAWSNDITDVPTLSVSNIILGTNAAVGTWPTSGSGISAAEAGQIATNVLSTATTNSMPLIDFGSGGGWTNLSFSGTGNAITNATAAGTTLTLERGTIEGGGGGGTADPFSSILVEADWTWTNAIYAVGANTSVTNIAITLPDAGTNFASVVVRKFSNLNQLRVVRGTNVVYTLYDDGSTRSYDWWPQYTNWYWRN
jgi:hypothetical protein